MGKRELVKLGGFGKDEFYDMWAFREIRENKYEDYDLTKDFELWVPLEFWVLSVRTPELGHVSGKTRSGLTLRYTRDNPTGYMISISSREKCLEAWFHFDDPARITETSGYLRIVENNEEEREILRKLAPWSIIIQN